MSEHHRFIMRDSKDEGSKTITKTKAVIRMPKLRCELAVRFDESAQYVYLIRMCTEELKNERGEKEKRPHVEST